MCGIVGFVKQDCMRDLYRGLRMLEYRGYDSVGVAYLTPAGVTVRKRVGRVEGLRRYCGGHYADVALGHTRWATHGAPTHANAHPHVAGRFALVHNGIIANYAALRDELTAQGVIFRSQTDTEVIVHLLHRYACACRTPDEVLAALRRTTARLRGSWAVAVLCADTPDCIYLCKQDNPLILGQGQGFYCFASDTPALVHSTDRICKMQDGQFALITRDTALLWQGETPIRPAFVTTTLSPAQVGKGAYPTYMAKEMAEIPRAMCDTQQALSQAGVPPVLTECPSGGIALVGCGTAYHACLYAAHLLADCPDVRACVASEYVPSARDRLVIAVSQSGETADTLGAVKAAKGQGKIVVAVTNVPLSGITQWADYTLLTRAGAEIAVAATKSYNTQLVALRHLCGALVPLPTAPDWGCAEGVYRALPTLDACARRRYDAVFLLGKGRDYATCLEGGLKIKEIAYCPCDAAYAGEIKHGPLACVTSRTLVVLVCTRAQWVDKALSALIEVRARGAVTLAISGHSRLLSCADYAFPLPDAEDSILPALAIQPLQYVAYRMALHRRLDPDKPRHLAKSVTVE